MKQQRVAAIIITVVTLASLYQVMGHDFTSCDDPQNLTANPHLTPPTSQGLRVHWTHSWCSLFIPLTYTIWSAFAALATIRDASGTTSLNPWIFHSANLLVHLFSALM